jgi:hypothetical protein
MKDLQMRIRSDTGGSSSGTFHVFRYGSWGGDQSLDLCMYRSGFSPVNAESINIP